MLKEVTCIQSTLLPFIKQKQRLVETAIVKIV